MSEMPYIYKNTSIRMAFFKVNFLDNVASSAERVEGIPLEMKHFETENGKSIIKWYIVDAADEAQSVEIAGKVANNIWGEIIK